ncbi:HET-domain-containing protein [Lophiostoma macrostomum CBS 122681]|uniref:HET-domain-containing protein n=1 Tax=Lophiostoma macrostomum CBS 122681 TaxID=1314788 RepID=A0A6A6SPM0_9PLEO|nr:HET-domain-containing protein [Lophiostoma macrostomum CBS 122681]
MHLLNVQTLKLEPHIGARVPKYAILSHTWGKEEVTFADIQNPTSPATTSLAGFDKIRKTCERAITDGYEYAWVDTCCIDKSSSAELSEAINSMFEWYCDASVCYAYLGDVSETSFEEDFPRSRWFTRGWTLQELIGPRNVRFFDQQWRQLGTKRDHVDKIADVTGIDRLALTSSSSFLHLHCVAKRMSWASNRETTRTEDMAYCLLGIFGVNMPLLYGEGRRAFYRLQEEILKNHSDDSILAWGLYTGYWDPSGHVPKEARKTTDIPDFSSLLAGSPESFRSWVSWKALLG